LGCRKKGTPIMEYFGKIVVLDVSHPRFIRVDAHYFSTLDLRLLAE